MRRSNLFARLTLVAFAVDGLEVFKTLGFFLRPAEFLCLRPAYDVIDFVSDGDSVFSFAVGALAEVTVPSHDHPALSVPVSTVSTGLTGCSRPAASSHQPASLASGIA